MEVYKQYKVIAVSESGLSVMFLGAATLPLQKIEMELNAAAAQGWQVVFQILEQKRHLLFWKVDCLVITLGR